jgi:drug/metabolite transporter (DMT)-like permease
VPAAYVGIILIWSSTPLAIKWSGEGNGFLFGITGRMFIGAAIMALLLTALRVRIPWHGRAVHAYLASSLGAYGSMMSVYWGAQYIPSGLISVIFGLSPVTMGLLASRWLGEDKLGPAQLSGVLLGLAGLSVIFQSSLSLGGNAWLGVIGVMLAVLLHSLSTVWIKRIASDMPALSITGGGVFFAMILYGITWLVAGYEIPSEVSPRTGMAIVYLAVFGTVLGFNLYFYVLKRISAATVALITLITPVTALLAGAYLNNETIAVEVWLGTGLILVGLVMHQWGGWFLRVALGRQRKVV